MFKKFLKTLLCLIIAAVIVAGAGAGIVFMAGKLLNASAAAYAKDAVSSMVFNWKPEELTSRLTPQMQGSLKPEDADKLFSMLRTLGKLKTLTGCTGQVVAHYPLGADSLSTTVVFDAQYGCVGEFENAPATIRLALLKTDKGWQIAGLNVDSKFFAQAQQPPEKKAEKPKAEPAPPPAE